MPRFLQRCAQQGFFFFRGGGGGGGGGCHTMQFVAHNVTKVELDSTCTSVGSRPFSKGFFSHVKGQRF